MLDSFNTLGIKKIKMAECVVDIESCLSEVLLKLNETGMVFFLQKEEQESTMHLLLLAKM